MHELNLFLDQIEKRIPVVSKFLALSIMGAPASHDEREVKQSQMFGPCEDFETNVR